jgi:hypothetical protein
MTSLNGNLLFHASFWAIIEIMFTIYKFNESAFNHDIIEEDIKMAFTRPLFDGLIEGYSNKFLLTGFDTRGIFLEIMYNLIDENTVYVFHAMPCRREYRNLRNQY